MSFFDSFDFTKDYNPLRILSTKGGQAQGERELVEKETKRDNKNTQFELKY